MATVRKKRKLSSPRKSSSNSVLPDSVNVPPTSLEDFICTIYGRKNIGKSSLAAEFTDNITYMFERGRRNLRIYQIPTKGYKLEWDTAREARDEIVEGQRFKRVTFDTIDRAYDACFRYICEANGCSHPDHADNGYRVWNEIKEEFATFIDSFREADIGITFVSHEKIKPLQIKAKALKRDGMELEEDKTGRLEPTCSGQAWGTIQEISEYVFYYGFVDGFRAITVRSPFDLHWTACGNSDETFLDPLGNQIESFAVGKNSKEAFQTLVKAFNNEVWDINYTGSKRIGGTPKKKKVRK